MIKKPCFFTPSYHNPLYGHRNSRQRPLLPCQMNSQSFHHSHVDTHRKPRLDLRTPGPGTFVHLSTGGYCLFAIAVVGALAVQVWVAMQFISTRRKQDVPQNQ